jgi:hypothetical protein
LSSPQLLFSGNDLARRLFYPLHMAAPRHDWYLKDWLRTLGVSQAWVAEQLRLQTSKISRKATGVTAYDRDDINAIAALLHLQPFELLLHPEEAHHIRRLRAAVEDEHRLRAAETRASFTPAEPGGDRLRPRRVN